MTKCEPRIDIDRELEAEILKVYSPNSRLAAIERHKKHLDDLSKLALESRRHLVKAGWPKKEFGNDCLAISYIIAWHERKWKLYTTYWNGAE